jgi:phage baseplate assembly protein W|tara:strand:- start:479 stop:886 length:408 start_codon:yes stop_codon:yes gene_type:complete
MAFGVRRVYPNDLRPRVAIGVDLPFSDPAVFRPNYQTKDAIKNNLINFFLTNPGERVLNPLFGGGLRNFVFTQISNDNLDFIQEDIQVKLNSNFPDVQVEDVEVFRNSNENTIQVKIGYNIPNTGINDTLELNFR